MIRSGKFNFGENSASCMVVTLLAVIVLFQFANAGFAAERTPCRIKVFSRHGGGNLIAPNRFFRALDTTINGIIPKQTVSKSMVYELILLEPDDIRKEILRARNKSTLRVGIPQSLDPLHGGDEKLLPAIGMALLLKAGLSVSKKQSAPRWIELALLRKIRRRAASDRILGVVSFPGVHALLTLPHPPKLLKALESPLRQSDGAAYEILMETCEVILDRVLMLPEGKKVVRKLLELSLQGLPPEDAFRQATGANLRRYEVYKGKSVEEWLTNGAASASLNLLHPGSAAFGLREFKKVTLVEYSPSRTDGEPHYCSIMELPKILDKIESPEILIRKKQCELERLAFSLPAPMQEAVSAVGASLDILRQGKNKEEAFAKALNSAMANFNAALDRCCAMENMLDNMEATILPPLWRYNAALGVVAKSKQRRQIRWPEITSFLDKIEHDMASQ